MKTSTKVNNGSPDEVQAVIAALAETHKKMTFLSSLNAEERQELRAGRIGPKTWRLLQFRVEAARKHREMLPATFDLRKFERDVELTAGLLACLTQLEQMCEAVNDTLLAVGHRAVQSGTVAYGYIKVAATGPDQLQNSVARAKRGRRANQGTPNPAPATPPVEPKKVEASLPAPTPPTAAGSPGSESKRDAA